MFFNSLNFVDSINIVTFALVELLFCFLIGRETLSGPSTLRTAVHIRRQTPDKEIQFAPSPAPREKEGKFYIFSNTRLSQRNIIQAVIHIGFFRLITAQKRTLHIPFDIIPPIHDDNSAWPPSFLGPKWDPPAL